MFRGPTFLWLTLPQLSVPLLTLLLLATPVTRLWAQASAAQPAPATSQLQVFVRTHTLAEQALLERLRGQTSDLPVTLYETSTSWPDSGSMVEQLAQAAQVAAEKAGDALIWLNETPTSPTNRVLIYLVTHHGSRVLMRSLEDTPLHDEAQTTRSGRPAEGSPAQAVDSAQLEVAALVARGALRELSRGILLGVTEAEVVAETASEAQPPAEEPQVARSDPPSAARPRGSGAPSFGVPWPNRHYVELGWQTLVDGETKLGHQGPQLRLAVGWGAFEIGVRGALGLPAQLQRQALQLALTRHAATAYAGYRFHRARWSLTPALGVTATAIRSMAETTDGSFAARRPSTHWFAAASPELKLGWNLTPHVHFSLALGLDILPEAPRFGYITEGAFMQTFQPWHLQPWSVVAIGATLP